MGPDTRSPPSQELPVEELREVSRKLVRELGFMQPTLANTGHGASAVHAVLEIGRTPGIQARELANLLRLDKSNMSRQLARLEAAGLVRRESAIDDARSYCLDLTDAGQALRGEIDRFSTYQVSLALSKLAPDDRRALIRCLSLYVEALNLGNEENPKRGEP
jgi:DNA-binding MarR family transcriptional regulator